MENYYEVLPSRAKDAGLTPFQKIGILILSIFISLQHVRFKYACGQPNEVDPGEKVIWYGREMVVNEDRHGGLSVLGFTKSGVCCCDCAWLRKATDNGEVNEGGGKPK